MSIPGKTPFSPPPHPQSKCCQKNKAIRLDWRNSHRIELGGQRGELESYWVESRLWATVDFCYAIVNKAGCWDQNTVPQERLEPHELLGKVQKRARDSGSLSARVPTPEQSTAEAFHEQEYS